MPTRIRDANREDADAIAAAHIASWRAGYAHIFPSSVFESPEFDRSRIEMWRGWTHSPTPDRRLLVATVDERVVGFAHTGYSDAPDGDDQLACGELLGFYTHPDVWGTGVAKLMMDAALSALRDLGVGRSILWTLTDAHRARGFYEKSGWSSTGTTDIWTLYPDSPVVDIELEHSMT